MPRSGDEVNNYRPRKGKAAGKSKQASAHISRSRDEVQKKHTKNTGPSERDRTVDGTSSGNKCGDQGKTTVPASEGRSGLNLSSGAPQNVFFLIGLIFGLIFVCLVPPLLAPDEWTHFQRAYYTSEGNMRAEIAYSPGSGRKVVGGMMPKSFLIAQKFSTLDIPYNDENVQRLPMLIQYNADKYLSQRKFHTYNILSLFDQPVTSHDERKFTFLFPRPPCIRHTFTFPRPLALRSADGWGFR